MWLRENGEKATAKKNPDESNVSGTEGETKKTLKLKTKEK